MNRGLLLVNLGTPRSPAVKDVRSYLREFLMDPYVINRPYWLRFLLVQCIIAPFRAPKSAKAYQKIWTASGSPLMVHTQALSDATSEALRGECEVRFAMRYGEPSIEAAVAAFKQQDIHQILALPLYPQFADSSSQTAIDAIEQAAEKYHCHIDIIESFYDKPEFIAALADIVATDLQHNQPEHVLFSFHGLPEEHIVQRSPRCRSCLAQVPCQEVATQACYRAQCYVTARLLARKLGVATQQYSVAFQSRLGKLPWIQPYTDEVITKLAERGVKKLQVVCAAFTADCLETIEEIGMESSQLFLTSGGQEFNLSDCLNASSSWVQSIAGWTRDWLNDKQSSASHPEQTL